MTEGARGWEAEAAKVSLTSCGYVNCFREGPYGPCGTHQHISQRLQAAFDAGQAAGVENERRRVFDMMAVPSGGGVMARICDRFDEESVSGCCAYHDAQPKREPPVDVLALADALAAAVQRGIHPTHSGITGRFERCVAEECKAARAYLAARRREA